MERERAMAAFRQSTTSFSAIDRHAISEQGESAIYWFAVPRASVVPCGVG